MTEAASTYTADDDKVADDPDFFSDQKERGGGEGIPPNPSRAVCVSDNDEYLEPTILPPVTAHVTGQEPTAMSLEIVN